MRSLELLVLLSIVIVSLAACSEEPQRRQPAAETDAVASFAAHSQNVFAALKAEPLDTTLSTEIGLFGNMSVDAGELVVMRRYRYRIDSTQYGPVGHMAFQIRQSDPSSDPIPVVLTFVKRDATWRLERAEHGRAAADSTPQAHGPHGGADRLSTDEPRTPLQRSLGARLDAWVAQALTRVENVSAE